ncbi:hypothetical protein EII25_03305 [Erysipelotrichaceae bacterium OH741_COT-311]|nr:hypothetical protein EII25_03305 [Erysipelotrichaceae bacterium OH741_COT-311]
MKLPYIIDHINREKWYLKCPNDMAPKYITIHNTYNKASARNEVTYMKRNNNPTSCHIFVDDKEAIEAIPLNRNAWHCGDGGKGKGNRQSIGIEICYSTDYSTNKHEKSFHNAVEVVKMLMEKFDIPIENVVQHNSWSGKDCPHRIRAEGTWNKFLSLCQDTEKEEEKKYNWRLVNPLYQKTEAEAKQIHDDIVKELGWDGSWLLIEKVN